MKKFFVLTALLMILAFAVNLHADPIQTTEQFWSAIFDEGDLKLAFSQIAAVDQDFIKLNAPELYNFVMGDVGDMGGDFGQIFTAFQEAILTTLGKVVKIQDVSLGDKTADGQEVNYSLAISADVDSYMELAKWVNQKESDFKNPNDSTPMMDKISNLIKELSQKLDNLSFKTSVSINTFVTVINENGQEKLLLNLALAQEKMKWLEEME